MSSVESLRDFVTERLTAAAEEIFRVFKQTVVEYEEEIGRQRRLLDTVLKPEIRLHRTEPHVCKEEEEEEEEEVLSSLEQEEPEPPQIKEEEEEEVCSSQEGEQLLLKQEWMTPPPVCRCEIFRVFKQTVVEYEEEIGRQRRLLDTVLKPEIRLHRTGL
ncbi:hypothetical protein INR49_019976 [Caranx melampygus]|nr:hypothetical protein INR49_019976 [Caranx melampygus]